MDSFTRRSQTDDRLDTEEVMSEGGFTVHRERITANGSEDYATGQTALSGTAAQIVAARKNRKAVLVINHGSVPVFLGKVGVTAATGVRLSPQDGAGIVVPTAAALYGITGGAGTTVSFLETF